MSQTATQLMSDRLATGERVASKGPGSSPRIMRGGRRTEMSIVRGMVGGEESAFQQFADVYIPRLHRFAMNRLNQDRELAREMVQATVVKAIDKMETFRGDSALMTWLCACCRSEIAMHFRSEGRGGPRQVFDEATGPVSSGWGPTRLGLPEVALLRADAARQVHQALDQLPPRYGRALEWKYLDELPVKEIAARLDLSPKAAESLLTRARNAFRTIFAASAGDGETVRGEDGAGNE